MRTYQAHKSERTNGYTFIELMVVIIIMGFFFI
jgi:prepilin-type N-terminal cleavage/methylation domain-containing protein